LIDVQRLSNSLISDSLILGGHLLSSFELADDLLKSVGRVDSKLVPEALAKAVSMGLG